jgi:hypothetical protein
MNRAMLADVATHKDALESSALNAYAPLLAEDVRCGDACHNRADVLKHLARRRAAGIETTLTECSLGHNAVLVGFTVRAVA